MNPDPSGCTGSPSGGVIGSGPGSIYVPPSGTGDPAGCGSGPACDATSYCYNGSCVVDGIIMY
jgi:hypothetical protein